VALYGVARSGGESHLWPVLVLALLVAAVGHRLPAQLPAAEGPPQTRAFALTLLACFALSVLSYVQLSSGNLIELNGDQGFYYRLARWLHVDSSEAVLLHAHAENQSDLALHPAYHYWDIWLLTLGMHVGLSGAAASGLVFKSLVSAVAVMALAQGLHQLHPQGLRIERAYMLALMGMGLYVVVPIGRLGLPPGSAIETWLAPFAMVDRLDNIVYRHKLLLIVAGGWIMVGKLAQQRLVAALGIGVLLWFLNPLYFLAGSVAGAAALLLLTAGALARDRQTIIALVLVAATGALGAAGVLLLSYPKAVSTATGAGMQHLLTAWPQLLADAAVSLAVVGALGWALVRWTTAERGTRLLLLSFWALSLLGYVGVYYSPLLAWNFELFQARLVFWPTLLLMAAVLLLTLSLAQLHQHRPRLTLVIVGSLAALSTGYLILFFQLTYARRHLQSPDLRISHADCAALGAWRGQRGALYIDPETQPSYPDFPSSQLQLCSGFEQLIDLPSPTLVARVYTAEGELQGFKANRRDKVLQGFSMSYPYFVLRQAPLHPVQDYDSLALRYVQRYDVRWLLALRQSALAPALARTFTPTAYLSDPRWILYVRTQDSGEKDVMP